MASEARAGAQPLDSCRVVYVQSTNMASDHYGCVSPTESSNTNAPMMAAMIPDQSA